MSSRPVFALAFVIASFVGDESRLPRDTLPREPIAAPPFGFPEAFPEPDGNAFSRARFDLGRRLFFDPVLSRDRTISCASCHQPEHGFAEPVAHSKGVAGRETLRNAPTIFNRAFAPRLMWDGRAESLEEQALLPIENELEMALTVDEVLARLKRDASYASAFTAAFDDGVTRANLGRAIASFVRRLTFGDSPVDRFRTGEVTGLTPQERAGMWLFESRGGCWRCHNGPNFSDEDFHSTGIGVHDGEPEPARAEITGDPADRGKFKTPTLRALAFTAPYMHDGSLATLEEVVDFYARGGNPHPQIDERLEAFELSAEDKAALVAFLRALSRTASAGDAAPPEVK